MLKIYWTDCAEPPKGEVPPLSEYRKRKLGRIRPEQPRRASLCAELLLIEALRREDPAYPLPLEIETDENGKPFLSDRACTFSLSHSSHYAACAISDRPVGLDIQILTTCREDLVRRFFAPGEQDLIFGSDDPDAAFTRLWCRKESCLKACGLGLRLALDSFDLSAPKPDAAYRGVTYDFSEYRAGDLFFCVCYPRRDGPEEFRIEALRFS